MTRKRHTVNDAKAFTVRVKRRSHAHSALPPVPLSELPIMKALLASPPAEEDEKAALKAPKKRKAQGKRR